MEELKRILAQEQQKAAEADAQKKAAEEEKQRNFERWSRAYNGIQQQRREHRVSHDVILKRLQIKELYGQLDHTMKKLSKIKRPSTQYTLVERYLPGKPVESRDSQDLVREVIKEREERKGRYISDFDRRYFPEYAREQEQKYKKEIDELNQYDFFWDTLSELTFEHSWEGTTTETYSYDSPTDFGGSVPSTGSYTRAVSGIDRRLRFRFGREGRIHKEDLHVEWGAPLKISLALHPDSPKEQGRFEYDFDEDYDPHRDSVYRKLLESCILSFIDGWRRG